MTRLKITDLPVNIQDLLKQHYVNATKMARGYFKPPKPPLTPTAPANTSASLRTHHYQKAKGYIPPPHKQTRSETKPGTRDEIEKFKRKKLGENSWIRCEHGYLCLNSKNWLGIGANGAVKLCLWYKDYNAIEKNEATVMLLKVNNPDDPRYESKNTFNTYAKLTGRKYSLESFTFSRHASVNSTLNLCVRAEQDNVVKVVKVKVSGKKYLVMPYLGIQIEIFLEIAELTLLQKLKIIIDLIEKLICLHKSNYAHRDINPYNICINYNERTKEFETELVDYDSLAHVNSQLTKGPVTNFIYTSPRYRQQTFLQRDAVSVVRTIYMPTGKIDTVIKKSENVDNSWSLLSTLEFEDLPINIKRILNQGRSEACQLSQLQNALKKYVNPSSKRSLLSCLRC